jgi:benzoate/toluate 1,2-dioxygenase beta subunit
MSSLETARTPVEGSELAELERFVYTEAQLADESRYDEWEALAEDDMIYWVPRGGGDFLPDRDVSLINDNRSRLATRIRQLKTGTRHSQTPVSSMRRLISNLVAVRTGANEYEVESNFALFEMQLQSLEHVTIWAGRTVHRLRRTDAGLRMHFKKVMLINGDQPVPTLAFLI